VVKNIIFPGDVVLPTTYLSDVRFDLRQGKAGVAYITESGSAGIIVVDLAPTRQGCSSRSSKIKASSSASLRFGLCKGRIEANHPRVLRRILP
jgi:hypothetical protein